MKESMHQAGGREWDSTCWRRKFSSLRLAPWLRKSRTACCVRRREVVRTRGAVVASVRPCVPPLPPHNPSTATSPLGLCILWGVLGLFFFGWVFRSRLFGVGCFEMGVLRWVF